MSSQAVTKREARPGAGRPNAEEAERKKIALVDAALAEFAERGFNGASLRVIAEKAGVSTRTLFNHYPDKAALFAGCIDRSSKQIAQVVAIRRQTLGETLTDYGVAMQAGLSSDVSRRIAMLIYRESAVFEEVRKIARLQFETYQVMPVVRILRDFGYQDHDLRDTAIQFVAMAFGKWQRRLLFGGAFLSDDETRTHMERVTQIFLSGIGDPDALATSLTQGVQSKPSI
jgi:AcrR family transcriptional regulator